MPESIRRREMLLALAATAATASGAPPTIDRAIVDRNDQAAQNLLHNQITDAASPWRGSVPDEFNLHSAGTAGGLIETCAASLLCPQSKLHQDATVAERIRLAAGFLERSQSPEGFIDLLSTNFNSPPDTGFVVHNVATAASIAKRYGNDAIVRALRPFLTKAADGMSVGGIHTPNHRWVVSAALAQVNEVYPSPAYLHRIDQWLGEGIDIDADGQYTERSTVTYNTVVNRAFVVMAAKLGRPQLLDPVRRNLGAMLYLLHPDGEVVTEVSRRQDQFGRGTMAGYWFSLLYLAIHDRDGQIATLARRIVPEHARLSGLLEYPELAAPLPEGKPLPEDYERTFSTLGLVRIRRGARDGTLVLGESSRFLGMRSGGAIVQAVRFATSFFGKGQFVPQSTRKEGAGYVFRQELDGPYYQPLDPAQPVTPANWTALRSRRRKTQICKLEQSAVVTETARGFQLRVRSAGTSGVPLAVEISLREGGQLEGCRTAPRQPDGWLLERDYAVYRAGGNSIRFGPGAAPHYETQLRGAEPKLPGTSVYITGFTPFDRTITFELA